MKPQYNPKDFLQETRYCDHNHPIIRQTAHEITRPYFTEKEKAVALFKYVRDDVLFKFGYWGKKASTVLKEKSGMCTNSANLLIALLRSSGIPAGYGIMRVSGQEYFGSVMLPTFKKMVAKNSVHIYSYVFLNNQWLKCDSSIDVGFSEQTRYFNSVTKHMYWDGTQDAIMNINQKHIFQDMGPLINIDKQLDKKPKNARGVPLRVANLYINFLRQNGHKIKESSELESAFLLWLRKNSPYFYLPFLITSKFKNQK